jgi:hypothetical protein
MNFYLDIKFIRKLVAVDNPAKNTALLLKTCADLANGRPIQFVLEWPSLLEYLGFGSLFETDPKVDGQNKIFSTAVEVLKLDSDREVIHYLYDQIFVECLTQIKKLPQIHPKILIDQIHLKRANPLFSEIEDPFFEALDSYEQKLSKTPYEAIHDLTLNLAWDRVCVYLGAIFDHATLKNQNGLVILKECLIESFTHIKLQGKTSPSFIRLVEALFAFYMKEENLNTHTENEWHVLCKGVETLHSRDYLPDATYIDSGIAIQGQVKQTLPVLTVEPLDRVKARLALVDLIMTKLKQTDPDWKFFLQPFEVLCVDL